MSGKLYLCATPIGNLEDITLRVLRTLKEVDLIAAEDTRNSIKLLNHFDIKTPMTSYHEYNKIEKAHTLIEKMQGGMNIALITDAGTPGISDPGEELAAIKATAENTFKKDTRITVRVYAHDFRSLKKKALQLGIPYHALISGIIHQNVEGELVHKTGE